MATIEKLGKGKGDFVGLYSISARKNGDGRRRGTTYGGLSPEQAFDPQWLQSHGLHQRNVTVDMTIGQVVDPGYTGEAPDGMHRPAQIRTPRGETFSVDSRFQNFFDPKNPDDPTFRRLVDQGVIVEWDTNQPDQVYVSRSPGRAIESLFRGARVERIPTDETRPLASFSEYVVEKLPDRLRAVRTGEITKGQLETEAERMLGDIDEETIKKALAKPAARDLAGLDLSFMETALIHSQIDPPEKLTRLLRTFSEKSGLPPTLTLERLVTINPLDTDPRLFTTGKTASAELGFYQGIRLIEGHWKDAIKKFEKARDDLDINSANAYNGNAPILINNAAADIADSADVLDTFMQMDKADFDTFIGYHMPTESGPGPSGLHSSIAVLDIELEGEKLATKDSAYFSKIREDIAFYPRNIRSFLTRAVRSKGRLDPPALRAFADRIGSTSLTHAVDGAGWAVGHYRGIHIKLAKKFHPELFDHEAKTTAQTTGGIGEKSEEYLKGRVRNT